MGKKSATKMRKESAQTSMGQRQAKAAWRRQAKADQAALLFPRPRLALSKTYEF
jgi:hypothetical protein